MLELLTSYLGMHILPSYNIEAIIIKQTNTRTLKKVAK